MIYYLPEENYVIIMIGLVCEIIPNLKARSTVPNLKAR